jgi:hypothetical protein
MSPSETKSTTNGNHRCQSDRVLPHDMIQSTSMQATSMDEALNHMRLSSTTMCKKIPTTAFWIYHCIAVCIRLQPTDTKSDKSDLKPNGSCSSPSSMSAKMLKSTVSTALELPLERQMFEDTLHGISDIGMYPMVQFGRYGT